jgi:predicted DNA-binding transcriptional regulator YafY
MRLHRLISILLTIENRGKITAKELASQFETSTRTIYRDVESLCEAGIPIVSETGPHGGLSLIAGYQTGVKQLQKEEIIYLFLNGMGFKADGSSEVALKLNTSLLKLQKLLSQEDSHELKTLTNRFYVDDTPWWGKRNPFKYIDPLMKALWESNKISISYQKTDTSITQRVLRPYGIVVKDKDWYLVAYCETNRALRTFKCERITDCRLLPESFTLPQDFSLEDYFKTSLKQFRTERNAIEQYPVTLRLSKSSDYLLQAFENFTTQEDGEDLLVTINMYSFENALDDFWNLLAKSCVIYPPTLQKAVKNHLENLIFHYSRP